MRVKFNDETELVIRNVFLDLNGTLAVKGKLVKGVRSRINKLKAKGLQVMLVSGDQRGNARVFAEELGIELIIAKTSSQKAKVIARHGAKTCITIGNARIDSGMFKKSALAIATLQSEGIHASILKHIDILVPSILDALDLLIDADSLQGTMKQ